MGVLNSVPCRDRIARRRREILGHSVLIIRGVVQNRDGIPTLLAEEFMGVPVHTSAMDVYTISIDGLCSVSRKTRSSD